MKTFYCIFTHGPQRWNRGSTDGLFLLLLLLLLHLLHTTNLGHWKYERASHAILFVKTGGTRGLNTLCRIVRPMSLPSLPQVTLWNNVETWTYHKNMHKTLVLQKLTMTGWCWRQSPWCPLSFWTTVPGLHVKLWWRGESNSRPKIVRPDPCKMWGDRYLNSLCRIDRPVSLPSLPQVTLWNNVETWT